MRILVTSTPGTGHLHPLVPIARECASRGHELLWATGEDAAQRVRSYGFTAVEAGLTLDERQRRFFATTDLSDVPFEQLRPVFLSGLFARISAPVMRDALAPIVDDFRPQVVLHELGELAAPAVAAARGIPYVTVAFSGAPYPGMIEPARPFMDELWSSEGLGAPTDFGWFDHCYLHPWPEVLGSRPQHSNVEATWHMGFDGAVGDAPACERGVPQVLVPLGADQLDNAQACAAAGVAVALGPAERDPDRVAAAVLRALGADEMRRACAIARDQVRDMPGAGHAADLVERGVG